MKIIEKPLIFNDAAQAALDAREEAIKQSREENTFVQLAAPIAWHAHCIRKQSKELQAYGFKLGSKSLYKKNNEELKEVKEKYLEEKLLR